MRHRSWAEEWLTVAAAEQEDESFQILAQLADAIGGMAGELFEGGAEAAGVTGQRPTTSAFRLPGCG
jgi:hypothetical protein